MFLHVYTISYISIRCFLVRLFLDDANMTLFHVFGIWVSQKFVAYQKTRAQDLGILGYGLVSGTFSKFQQRFHSLPFKDADSVQGCKSMSLQYAFQIALVLKRSQNSHLLKLKVSIYIYMGVSKNRGTPKSSISIGFSIIFTIHFGGPPLLLVQHPFVYICVYTSLETYRYV